MGVPFSNGVKNWKMSRVTEQLFFFSFFFFLFSLFLWTTLGLLLLFPLAFVFFSLITHICFSLFKSGFPRWFHHTSLFDVRPSRQPPGKRVPRQLPCPLLVNQHFDAPRRIGYEAFLFVGLAVFHQHWTALR